MHKVVYKPAKRRLLLFLLVVFALVSVCAAGILRARVLILSVLDGRSERITVSAHLPEYALRAQMNSQQAATRVNGFLTIAEQKEVTIKIDGKSRYARVFEPIGEVYDAPWAVILHGGPGSNGTDMLDMVCEFSASGYRVLLPDLYAHGRSEGLLSGAGYFESRDVEAWTAWIRMQEPSARIVLYGQDEGAAAVLLALDSVKDIVCAAAADSAYSSVSARVMQMFEETYGENRGIDRWLFEQAANMLFKNKDGDRDILQAVAGCSIPLLLIHGTGDEDVPAWHSEDIAAAAGEKAELFFVEGALHGAARFTDPRLFYDRLFAFYDRAVNRE